MLNYHFLLDLAIILLSTKVLGIITRKIHMPQVVGALAAGLLLGPAVFNMIHETEFIKQTAEIGVIVLMFTAGLEIDIKELKKCGKSSFIIALFGVLVPLAGGFAVAALFNNGTLVGLDTESLLQNIFLGIILTATSVSITVETLQEMGKLKTRSGTVIIGAALIDDIIGIIVLTFITSSAGSDSNTGFVLLKILLFFAAAAIIGILFFHVFNTYSKRYNEKRRFPIIAFSFCLIIAYAAEHIFGVADIAGAFIAGLVISGSAHTKYIKRRFGILSYLFLSPIFFASIGISVSVDSITGEMIIFSIILLLVAVLSKVLGCGIGAKLCKYSKKESLQVGVGMVARSEVALIVANKGVTLGLLNSLFFTPVIFLVIVTSIAAPILLKLAYGKSGDNQIECTEGFVEEEPFD